MRNDSRKLERGWRNDMAGRKPWRKTDHPDVPGESRTEGGRADLHIKTRTRCHSGSVQGSPKRSLVNTPHVIPTGGQDYFIGVVHAHALGIIWMKLYVERSIGG